MRFESSNTQGTGEFPGIRAFEERARHRPCTRAILHNLEREFEEYVVSLRGERELRRAQSPIEPESASFHKALHSVRIAIREAQAEHSRASCQFGRVRELVRLGYVHEARIMATQNVISGKFADLDLDFVQDALLKQQKRELRLLRGFLVFTGVVFGVVCLVETLHRFVRK